MKEDKKEKREENGSGDAPANGTVSGRQGCQICSQGCQIGRGIWPQSGNSGGGTVSLEARVARLGGEFGPNLATLVGVQRVWRPGLPDWKPGPIWQPWWGYSEFRGTGLPDWGRFPGQSGNPGGGTVSLEAQGCRIGWETCPIWQPWPGSLTAPHGLLS